MDSMSPGAHPAQSIPPPRPRSANPGDLGFTPRGPVRWLAPGMLARTGVQVALSTVFGAFADRRELEGIESGSPLDLSGAGDHGEFWFDYVADTGDGFHPVTTVASQLAADELRLTDETGAPLVLPHGSLLVLGGDECYPVASSANYTDRMAGPFRAMLPWADEPRTVLALPGNHDWYDGLRSFLRQFCQRRWIGGWRTEQSRSYFAARLPHGWWLWGIDVALGGDIDQPQLKYFREIAGLVGPDDAIVLCWAMPSWVEAGPANPEAYAPLEYFERTVIPDRAMLRLSLSGDQHHYARYQGQDHAGQQKITAGGGGAYLFATHRLPEKLRLPPEQSKDVNKQSPVEYQLRERYPSAATSRSLRWGIFGSVFRSPKFWAIPALVYLIAGIPASGVLFSPDGGVGLVLMLVLAGAVWCALTVFARSPGLKGRLLGLTHLLAHLVFVVAAFAGASVVPWPAAARAEAVPLLCGVVGALIGPVVTAAYLIVADLFGVNTDELFSAQAIAGYKSFLRLRIAPDGTLTVFPIKIERPVRWTFAGPDEADESVGSDESVGLDEAEGPGGATADQRWFRPADGVEPHPELIEAPITVTKRPLPVERRL